LADIAEVTQARLSRLGPVLDSWSGIVIHCPDCRQPTWTFEPYSNSSQCRFCGRAWWQESGQDAAEEYVGSILGESRYEAAKGRTGWSIGQCPECDDEAFVEVATRENSGAAVCFQCGFVTTEPTGNCGKCGRATADLEEVICADCLDYLVSRD